MYISNMKKVHRLERAKASDYLTTEEAAERLRIKNSAIRNYLYEGKLTTYKFKTLTLLKVEEIEHWKGRRKKH